MSSKWTGTYLDEMRQTTDPLADGVISKIIDQYGVAEVNILMRQMGRENESFFVSQLPKPVYDYFEETAVLPSWYDPHKAKLGQKLFNQYQFSMVSILSGASLPFTYTSWRGAYVLAYTQRMSKDVRRRLFETVQFVYDVVDENAFEPGGVGLRSAQKVRLIHAAVRYHLKQDAAWQQEWDMTWGEPLNQEEMAGTLMAFSVIVLNALMAFNLKATIQEKEGYLHLWCVVGHVLGLDRGLIPANLEEAQILTDLISNRNQGESVAGRELTKSLIEFIDSYVPGHLFDGMTSAMIRKCLTSEEADMLGVPQTNWTNVITQIHERSLDFGYSMGNPDTKLSGIADSIQQSLFKALRSAGQDGEQYMFDLPTHLRFDMIAEPNQRVDKKTLLDSNLKGKNIQVVAPSVSFLSSDEAIRDSISPPTHIPWIMHQTWQHLLFMHWAVDSSVLSSLIPKGMTLDLFDGCAWLTLVPFWMADIRLRNVPSVFGWGTRKFPEVNLRTYVRVNNRPGLFFLSIDAGSRIDALVASKLFHLPYTYSRMTFEEDEQLCRLTSNRSREQNGLSAMFDASYQPVGKPFIPHPDSLDYFLVERYALFSQDLQGTIYRGDVKHDQWILQEAEAVVRKNTILTATGLDLPHLDRPKLHYSVGQSAKAWPVVPVSWIHAG